MASTTDMDVMAGKPPSGVIDLYMAANFSRDQFCHIMGVVTDVLEPLSPERSKAKDWQIKFLLHDTSPQAEGFTVKYFAREVIGLPAVACGDVILLRELRVSEYRGQVGGISNNKTNFVVFPSASIVDTGFRHQYAVNDQVLPHTKKSSMTAPPSIHAQQWAITLKHKVLFEQHATDKTTVTDKTAAAVTVNQTSQKYAPSTATAPKTTDHLTRTAQQPMLDSRRATANRLAEKFSTLELVTAGNFYDLVVEVVKIFSNIYGNVELYVTDYTANDRFRDYEKPVDGTDDNWRGPHGKMTLRVDLMPPHSQWAFDNILENEIVSLKNVLIKPNKNMEGGLEGNIWKGKEKWNAGQINVRKARAGDLGYEDLLARRRTYKREPMKGFFAGHVRDNGEQKDKKKKKGRTKKKDSKDPSDIQERGVAESTVESSKRLVSAIKTNLEESGGLSVKRRRLEAPAEGLARNVSCMHPDVPLSTYSSVVHSELRANQTPQNRISYTLPFINVKHRVHLRCTDFYPHDIRDFARTVIDPGPSSKPWEWMFYLVVVAGDPSDPETHRIHLQVSRTDAEVLLRLPASNLHSPTASRAVEHLRSKLWMLWGDLEECKTRFLAANPNIEANEEWSCMNAGIAPSNVPFEACVEEFGVRFPCARSEMNDEIDIDGNQNFEGEGMCWTRAWRLFDTQIK